MRACASVGVCVCAYFACLFRGLRSWVGGGGQWDVKFTITQWQKESGSEACRVPQPGESQHQWQWGSTTQWCSSVLRWPKCWRACLLPTPGRFPAARLIVERQPTFVSNQCSAAGDSSVCPRVVRVCVRENTCVRACCSPTSLLSDMPFKTNVRNSLPRLLPLPPRPSARKTQHPPIPLAVYLYRWKYTFYFVSLCL